MFSETVVMSVDREVFDVSVEGWGLVTSHRFVFVECFAVIRCASK